MNNFDLKKYLVENKLTKNSQLNKVVLNTIAQKSYNKFPEINKGLCFDFAYIIGKNFNIDKAILIYNKEEDIDFGEPIHTALIVGNEFYDSNGLQSFNELKNNWGGDYDNPFFEEIKINGLKNYLKNNKIFNEFLDNLIGSYVTKN